MRYFLHAFPAVSCNSPVNLTRFIGEIRGVKLSFMRQRITETVSKSKISQEFSIVLRSRLYSDYHCYRKLTAFDVPIVSKQPASQLPYFVYPKINCASLLSFESSLCTENCHLCEHLDSAISSKQYVKQQKQFYRDFSSESLGAPLKYTEAPLLGDLCQKYGFVISRTSADVGLNYVAGHKHQIRRNMSTSPQKEFKRLPTEVVPTHYVLELQPNLETFTFEGNTSVYIKVGDILNMYECKYVWCE